MYGLPVIDPENKKLPAERLSQAVKNVASCEPAMFTQEISASEVMTPFDDAPKDASFLVVSVAGFPVPLAPGSPT